MSAIARNQVLTAVHTVGGLLPTDMLLRIAEGRDVPGSKPADYGVVGSRSVADEAERHWDYVRSLWRDLRTQLPAGDDGTPASDPTGIALTNWVLPLFNELGFGLLPEAGAGSIVADDDAEKVFPLSHRWQHVPIHVPAWATELDRRPGGAGTVPPQSLVQEALNRTSAHLWAVVTNGRQLRLLRDSSALATAAYVEFDLEAIFDGELFNEFVLLYRLLHASRFQVKEGEPPAACWLEKWRTEAISSGVQALDALRENVEEAIRTLGTGFLKHPANTALRADLDVDKLHKALLRLVYRLLFLFVIEDRGVLHPDDADTQAKERYAKYFSSARLRSHARRRRGTAHSDQYRALRIVLAALSEEEGLPELALPGLGGLFDDTEADAALKGLELSNHALLAAVRHLALVRDPESRRWRPVDYRNMGSEELGSVYESLLETVPKYNASDRSFDLVAKLGNERKKTGSYYTPTSLIETLLDSSLELVIDDAFKRGEEKAAKKGTDPSEAIVRELLSLKVCDPACGSGHFLVAAARRIAKKVAAVREENPEPTVDAVRHAMHEVVAHCIYGVDLNPMAVELAKVSLWLEAVEPGRPLNFLDAHVKHGNALIGATPRLLEGDIPDAAFKPVEGDDPKYAASFGEINAQEMAGQGTLMDVDRGKIKVANAAFAEEIVRITGASAGSLAAVRRQEEAYRRWRRDVDYVRALHVADAWCAAFMWRKTEDAPPPVTYSVFRGLADPEGSGASAETNAEIVRLREQYRFFHWHLEFPQVFTVPEGGEGVDERTGWAGGFDCVLGNPPWDKVDFEDKKYFSVVEPEIAKVAGVARRKRIEEWEQEFPEAGEKYRQARRTVKSTFLFTSRSNSFPKCQEGLKVKGVNSLQTDHLFAEKFGSIVSSNGRYAMIIPTTIATGAAAQYLFKDLTERKVIRTLYGFENGKKLFQGVHASYSFCLFSLGGREVREPVAKLAFFLHDPVELDSAERTFELTPEDIQLINPNTGTLPVFRNKEDARITAEVYRRIPVLWNESKRDGNPWGIKFKRLFDMTDDSGLFRSREELERDGWKLEGNIFYRDSDRMLPLYEGKMIHYYDHSRNTFIGMGNDDVRQPMLAERSDPTWSVMPRYWVPDFDVPSGKTDRMGRRIKIPGVSSRLAEVGWGNGWLLGWRDVARATDERTAIPAFMPRVGVGHTVPLIFSSLGVEIVAALSAAQSSFVHDFVGRQKASGAHMALMTWKQLPVPAPEVLEPHSKFLVPRVEELVYTADDMELFARDLGDEGAPFRWDEERRAVMRAELDALFFHLYGINRDDVDYIMETFPIVKRKDVEKYGTYRTKEIILEIYDRMAEAGVSPDTPLIDGENFTSTLTPPPGHGPRHAPA